MRQLGPLHNSSLARVDVPKPRSHFCITPARFFLALSQYVIASLPGST